MAAHVDARRRARIHEADAKPQNPTRRVHRRRTSRETRAMPWQDIVAGGVDEWSDYGDTDDERAAKAGPARPATGFEQKAADRLRSHCPVSAMRFADAAGGWHLHPPPRAAHVDASHAQSAQVRQRCCTV